MAHSYLLLYEPLEVFGKKKEYWFHYIKFYESYWGGPTSPYGVFFGNEYNHFRKSLARYLEIEEKKVEDCYFMKDETGRYYISLHNPPVDTYILSSKNHIPFQWFLLFDHSQKKSFSTRLDFSRIHFTSKIKKSVKRLDYMQKLIGDCLTSDKKNSLNSSSCEMLMTIHNGVFELQKWISGFDTEGFVILDYGEICSFTDPSFVRNENSVNDLQKALNLLENGEIEGFQDKLTSLSDKWNNLRARISNRINTNNTIQ